MGLATAYYLARAHKSVLLLEQHDLANAFGSSKGVSRFFRIMYSDIALALLAQASDPLWRQLENDAGVNLRDMNGLLFWGTPEGVETPEGNLPGCKATMDALGIRYDEFGSPRDLQAAYPILKNLPGDCIGLYQADAGVIHAEETCRAYARLGRDLGVLVRTHEQVVSIGDANGGTHGVVVETSAGTYYGRKLVLAVGMWTNDVLGSLGVQLDLRIWEMTVSYYRLVAPKDRPYPMWFYFGLPSGDDGGTYYSIPPVGSSDRVKVSTDFTNHIFGSAKECTGVPDERILELVQEFVDSHIDGLGDGPIPEATYTCNYTVAPRFAMKLDFVPGQRDIVVFTGEGGQAFKFAPLFGMALSELVLAGTTRHNISNLAIRDQDVVR